MEVLPNTVTKVRKHITPVKAEDQIIPAAAVLKRGRLDLGVVLCIRGNKIHYYSFASQGKVSVFEDWLFKMPVKLGLKPVSDFNHLKNLFKLNLQNVNHKEKTKKDVPVNFKTIQNVFSKIEAVTLSNCINSNTCAILKQLDKLTIDIKRNSEETRKFEVKILEEARTTQERINGLTEDISTIHDQLNDVKNKINYEFSGNNHQHQEFHVTNSLYVKDCYFEQPVESFRKSASEEKQKQSNASAQDTDSPKTQETSEEENLLVFRVNSVIKEHHWKKFLMHYRSYSIIDVYFSELQWMRDMGMFELVKKVAPYVMGDNPLIERYTVEKSLRILFDILRTSHICR